MTLHESFLNSGEMCSVAMRKILEALEPNAEISGTKTMRSLEPHVESLESNIKMSNAKH